MQPLSEEQFTRTAKAAFDKVFMDPDPFGAPFRTGIEPRLLLCPFNYAAVDPWEKPFVSGLRRLNESWFFVSVMDRPPAGEQKMPYHWRVTIEQIDAYGRGLPSLENTVYSGSGTWGLIASHEDFALIAGPEELINEFKFSIPDLDQRIHDFLDLWASYHVENQADVKWIGTMLAHVFGRDQANGYIEGSEIRSLLGTG